MENFIQSVKFGDIKAVAKLLQMLTWILVIKMMMGIPRLRLH